MTEKMKKCPFCGGDVRIIKASDDLDEPIFGYYMITRGRGKNGCRCRLFMESDRFSYEDKRLARIAKANLIVAWNRRAE